MRRVLPLALLLAACADPPAEAPAPPGASPAPEAPLTAEDSAAVLQAELDSLREALAETQADVEAGVRETDSLRQALDDLGGDIEATRERASGLDAQLGD